jgi:predicted GH43/DUF377 family glycosyl hydrolase
LTGNFVKAIFCTFILLVLCANIAIAQNEWDKHYNNPILNLGVEGSWDKAGVSNPSVIFKDNEYKMWYTGFDGKNMRIGYATSIDGLDWVKNPNNPILDLGQFNSWDSVHVANPTVLFDGILYKMWFTGFDGNHMRIGYANSSDGIHWEKYPENPVLDIGAWGNNKDSDVWSPSVVLDGTSYKMWYTSFDGNMKIGYAQSSDGIRWTKRTSASALNIGTWGSWDDRGVWSPCVALVGFEYKMWYTGWNGTSVGIGYATSTDGANWIKQSNNPALSLGTTGTWDYYYASNATVILHDKKYKMWYSGCSYDEIYRIGYAVGATRPEIYLSDIFHDFDDTDVGKNADWEFTIYNSGNNDLQINSIASDNAVFAIISPAFDNEMKPVAEYMFTKPYIVPPYSNVNITVRFNRGEEKNYKGTINIISNDKNNPQSTVQLWMGSKLKYVRPIPDSFVSFDKDLQFGAKGQDIRCLQIMLAEEGPYVYPESEINCEFDEFTRKAVFEFQRKHKLSEKFDYVGSETRKKLTELLDRHRREKYDRVASVYDAVMGNYKDFLPDDFPPELVLAVASQESGLFYNFNNELAEVKENGNKNNVGRGIMQITSSEFVGAGNKASDSAYDCRNLINKESIYNYYSNTPQGVEANIRDGLYALKTKYNSADNCTNSKELDISSQEMRWFSTIQRYNTYNKMIFTTEADSDSSDYLNRCKMPDKLLKVFESDNEAGSLSQNAIISVEEQNRRWSIIDDPYMYILKRDNDTFYAYRAGSPTVYIKNVADKLRRLKSQALFPKLNGDNCDDLADKMEAVYNNSQSITLGCPAEIKVYDSDGRMTGSLIKQLIGDKNLNNGFDPSSKNGAEEIPNSIYDGENKTIVLMFPSDTCRYEIIGTGEGVYNLNITNVIDGKMIAFNAVSIPITSKTIHQYTIDWNALYQNKKGITLQMDSDGDRVFEKTISTDKRLIYSQIDPQL